MAERVGFEPTCRLRDKTLSRRPRYDHFGTSPQSRTASSRPMSIARQRASRRVQLYAFRRARADSARSSTRRTSSNSSTSPAISSRCAFDTKRGFGFCFVCATRAAVAESGRRPRFAMPTTLSGVCYTQRPGATHIGKTATSLDEPECWARVKLPSAKAAARLRRGKQSSGASDATRLARSSVRAESR